MTTLDFPLNTFEGSQSFELAAERLLFAGFNMHLVRFAWKGSRKYNLSHQLDQGSAVVTESLPAVAFLHFLQSRSFCPV